MGKKTPFEQRAKVAQGYSAARSLAFSISRAQAWAVLLVGFALTAILDVSTGDRIWVGPLYLAFIGLAAWALGRREALGALAVAMLFSLFANSDHLYPYGSAVTLPDFLMRIPPVLALILLLSHARLSCEREWSLARTDPLTGALNRKAFFELAGEVTRSDSWHVLAYADLDGLKRLNDEHGHEQGDRSLKLFASHVRKVIRRNDIFARVGGDEFLVYLAVRDAQAGMTVADRLHRAMNSATTSFAGDLQCSVGALILSPGARSIDRELRAADQLMYEAKQRGAALTVATATEVAGELALSGRWMLTGSLPESPESESEFRDTPRTEKTAALSSKAAA